MVYVSGKASGWICTGFDRKYDCGQLNRIQPDGGARMLYRGRIMKSGLGKKRQLTAGTLTRSLRQAVMRTLIMAAALFGYRAHNVAGK